MAQESRSTGGGRLAAGIALALAALGILFWLRRREPGRAPRAPAREVERAGDPGPRLAPGAPAEGAGALSGRVEGPDGAGLPGATVAAQRHPAPGEPFVSGRLPVMVPSQPDGAFRFERLPAGRYSLAASAPGLPGVARTGIEVAPGQVVTGVELRFVPGGFALSGRVTEAGRGTISGARVVAQHYGRSVGGRPETSVFTTESDGEGRYRLQLAAGQYAVHASADGYTQAHVFLKLAADQDRNFQLEPGAHISGRVVMAREGQPVAGAEVVAAPAESGPRLYYGPIITDEGGTFRLDGLPPGRYALAARKGGLVGKAGGPIVLVSAGGADNLVIAVSMGAVVTGTVKSRAGLSIAGAQVYLQSQDSPLRYLAHGPASSDERGRYRIEGVEAGDYLLRADADGHPSEEADATISGPLTHDFVLSDGELVSAVVLDASDRPVPGASIQATTQPAEAMAMGRNSVGGGVTDSEGRFTFKGLEAGLLTVTARKGDEVGRLGPQPLAAGVARPLTVRLAPGAHLSGTVTWDDGQPAASIDVRGHGGDYFFSHGRSSATGAFSLGPFLPGQISVSMQVPGDVSSSSDEGPDHGNFSLAAGEHKTGARLRLSRRNSSIAGLVVGPDQQPLAGVVVQAAREHGDRPAWLSISDGDGRGRAVTGGDGRFVVEGLPRASFTLFATHPHYPRLAQTGVAAGAGEVRLRLQRGASLAGVAVTAQGAPLPSYRLTISPHAGDGESGSALAGRGSGEPLKVDDPAGAFRVEMVAAGSYDLVAFAEDGQLAMLTGVILREGENKAGLRLVANDKLTIPGGLGKAMRAGMMFGISKP
jgi:protocatechuate 3,4-dioxygenase beta subunit